MSFPNLSPEQAHALFDILTHHQIYSEICGFKHPDAIRNYGTPFSKSEVARPSSPLTRMMFTSLVMKLPGISTLQQSFWQNQIATLVARLSEADLSESYDKGTMGIRKTLATATSVLIENCSRGTLGGCPEVPDKGDTTESNEYDRSKAGDLKRAWEKAAYEAVYGSLIDEVYDQIAASEKVEDMSPLLQAAIDHIILMIASFTHHVFVLAPDGQYLLRLLGNVNKLIPYMAIKQTLRIGNAATMINGMLKLMLTKMSVTAFTNWIGWSNNADDGTNLLQQIISTVLTWDNSDFKAIVTKIEKAKNGPQKEHLDAISRHIDSDNYEQVRAISISQSKSIVCAILSTTDGISSSPLSEAEHAQVQEYYAAKLSIRDRKQLIEVLCSQSPDVLTQAIRGVVAVFDPFIRSVHNNVDLSSVVGDIQEFIDDTIKTVKPRDGNNNVQAPSVGDFVALFRRHLPSYLRFLHQVLKNCPDVSSKFRSYCKEAIQNFRKKGSNPNDIGETRKAYQGAGAMTSHLTILFSSLNSDQKPHIIAALDAHSAYLSSLRNLSAQRAQLILDNVDASMYGPGVYLARWHGLLDETLITPATTEGPVRKGKDVQFKDEEGKTRSSGKGWWDSEGIAESAASEVPDQPDVSVVVDWLGDGFRELLCSHLDDTTRER